MKIYVTVPGVKKDIYRALLHQYINFLTKKVDSTSQCFGSGYFGRIRLFWLDPGVSVDPGISVGSGYLGRIRLFWSDPGILVRSGYYDRIRVLWSGPGILVGSGYFGRIRKSYLFDVFFQLKNVIN